MMKKYNFIYLFILLYSYAGYSQHTTTYSSIDSFCFGEYYNAKHFHTIVKGQLKNGHKQGLFNYYLKDDTTKILVQRRYMMDSLLKEIWYAPDSSFFHFISVLNRANYYLTFVFDREYPMSNYILYHDKIISGSFREVYFSNYMYFDNTESYEESINKKINTTWWFDISKGEFIPGNGPSYDMILLDTAKVVANSIETVAIAMKVGYDKKDSISTIAKGQLINGLREGKFKLYSTTTNHLLKEQSYHKGIPTGQFMQFYENGNIYSIGTQTEEYTVIHFLDKKERYSKTIYYPMHKKEASIEITYNKMPVFEYKMYGITQKKYYFDKAKNYFFQK